MSTPTVSSVAEMLTLLPTALDMEWSRGSNEHPATFDEVVVRVRQDFECCAQVGFFPAGTRFSVRKRDHNSMTVELVAWAGAVFCPEYVESLMDSSKFDEALVVARRGNRRNPERTEEINSVLASAEIIANRHNYDNSQIEVDYFNVGYYLDVNARTVEAHATRGIKLEADPAFVALVEKARAAVAIVGKPCAKATLGRAGIEAAGQWTLDQLIKQSAKLEAYAAEFGYAVDDCTMIYAPSSRRWLPCLKSKATGSTSRSKRAAAA